MKTKKKLSSTGAAQIIYLTHLNDSLYAPLAEPNNRVRKLSVNQKTPHG